MKNKWLIIFGICVIILIAVSVLLKDNPEDYFNDLTYSQLNEKIGKEEDFVLYVKQTSCTHCQAFSPKLQGVLSKYNLKIDVLNLTHLTSEESSKAEELLNIEGTPVVLFYKKGKVTDTKIEGNKDKDVIIYNFKLAGYINEDD